MAHFAEIDENNIVQRVIVLNDQFDNNETEGEKFCQKLTGSIMRWIRTSYNGNIRYNYAGEGMLYDEVNDAFIPTKPFDSWILNEQFRWESPIPYPICEEDEYYIWDETSTSWKKQ
jgi:hypothetical protein